jgi:hypothetical protein
MIKKLCACALLFSVCALLSMDDRETLRAASNGQIFTAFPDWDVVEDMPYEPVFAELQSLDSGDGSEAKFSLSIVTHNDSFSADIDFDFHSVDQTTPIVSRFAGQSMPTPPPLQVIELTVAQPTPEAPQVEEQPIAAPALQVIKKTKKRNWKDPSHTLLDQEAQSYLKNFKSGERKRLPAKRFEFE